MQRPVFVSVQDYGRLFTDAAYWGPYVEAACARHGFSPCREIRAGLPGTMPVFIVDNRVVVKFFSDLFHGQAGFRVEHEMYALLAGCSHIPTPAMLASGTLFAGGAGWPWPYVISRLLPGQSVTEAEGRLSATDRLVTARYLAPIVRRIHALQPAPGTSLRTTWDAFDHFLRDQRAGVIAQIEAYIPPLHELVDHRLPPHVMHCDLNADHVLGSFDGDNWQPTGIIDFGDARTGDRLYELVALHIGLFHGDKALLRAFLETYGFDDDLRRDFAHRALSMTLLHEFNVLGEVVQRFPGAAGVESLEELAACLWDLEQHGFRGPPGD